MCRTVLRWRRLATSPASRSTVTCSLTDDSETASRLASCRLVITPVIAASSQLGSDLLHQADVQRLLTAPKENVPVRAHRDVLIRVRTCQCW